MHICLKRYKLEAHFYHNSDIWILKGLYPGISVGSVIGSDAVGYITKNGSSELPVGQRVIVNPGRNWISDERGPEGAFGIMGLAPVEGSLTDEPILVDNDDLIACPEHLSNVEAATLPLAGVTAYR